MRGFIFLQVFSVIPGTAVVVLVLHNEDVDRLHSMTTAPGTYCNASPRRNTSTAIELY